MVMTLFVRVTRFINWKPRFRHPGIENLWTDQQQTGWRWLRRGPHPACKLWYFYPHGGGAVCIICVKLSSFVSVCIFKPPLFFTYSRTCTDCIVWPIFVIYGSKDVFSRHLLRFLDANFFTSYILFFAENAKFFRQ